MCIFVFPCATTDRDTFSNLTRFASEAGVFDQVKFVGPGENSSLDLFESFRWAERLRNKVVELGRELYGTGADYVFPVEFLISRLEGWLSAMYWRFLILLCFLSTRSSSGT